METSGSLLKMTTSLDDSDDSKKKSKSEVLYGLPLDDANLPLNKHVGKRISFKFSGDIFCIKCGKKTKKSFNQGFCYGCFLKAPECEECVLRPELCQAHRGIARDLEFARTHCLQKHYVYLSLTSGVKVGVTRSSQIPTRWIDQGARAAIKLARTPNRYTAGLIEVALKKHMADKTDWRKMLKDEYPEDTDLKKRKEEVMEFIPDELLEHVLKDKKVTRIDYPVQEFPEKVKSLGFDKQPEIEGVLMGIKGQYLIFDEGRVLNIRKHQGYRVKFQA